MAFQSSHSTTHFQDNQQHHAEHHEEYQSADPGKGYGVSVELHDVLAILELGTNHQKKERGDDDDLCAHLHVLGKQLQAQSKPEHCHIDYQLFTRGGGS